MAGRPVLMLPAALLEDAEQVRRVVEEEITFGDPRDVGDAALGLDCLSPDSIDQVGVVEAKDRASQARDISVALVREFLGVHRRECRDAMDTFEAALRARGHAATITTTTTTAASGRPSNATRRSTLGSAPTARRSTSTAST